MCILHRLFMRGPSQVCLCVFLHGLLECIIASPGWCWSDISFHCMFRLCSDAYPSPGSLGFDVISNSVLLPHQGCWSDCSDFEKTQSKFKFNIWILNQRSKDKTHSPAHERSPLSYPLLAESPRSETQLLTIFLQLDALHDINLVVVIKYSIESILELLQIPRQAKVLIEIQCEYFYAIKRKRRNRYD